MGIAIGKQTDFMDNNSATCSPTSPKNRETKKLLPAMNWESHGITTHYSMGKANYRKQIDNEFDDFAINTFISRGFRTARQIPRRGAVKNISKAWAKLHSCGAWW